MGVKQERVACPYYHCKHNLFHHLCLMNNQGLKNSKKKEALQVLGRKVVF